MKFIQSISVVLSLAATTFAQNYELLKDHANGFKIGVAANTMNFSNGSYMNALKSFNYMVAENACKLSGIQQRQGVYDFTDCDNHLKKAQELGMDFRGHTLVWHSYMPSWFENANASTLKNSIVDHITKVLQHYDGKIDTWDVVNEAIDDSSNGKGWKMRDSFLYRKVPNFVDLAFQTARKVAPNVKLFYNDYNTEGVFDKTESVFQFVEDMKSRGIPIDGVGLQYHVAVNQQPSYSKIDNLISRYCDLGLEVHITEMDVKCDNVCNSGNVDEQQATVYSNALKACLNNSCCTGFLVWGVGDNNSWLGGGKKALLFNSNYQPKKQYTALLNVLKEYAPKRNPTGGSTDPKTGGSTGKTGDAIPMDQVIKIMPIGDSITFGMGETGGYRKYLYNNLIQKGYKIDMVGPEGSNSATTNGIKYDDNHAGYSGFQIKEIPGWGQQQGGEGSLYNKLKSKNAVKQANPDIVLLLIGTNDMTANRSMDACASDLHDLVDYILEGMPAHGVIFMGSIPEFTAYGGNAQRVANYNGTVKKVAEEYGRQGKKVYFADVHGSLNGTKDLGGDGLHPNSTGYKKMGNYWSEVVDQYIRDSNARQPEEPEEPEDVSTCSASIIQQGYSCCSKNCEIVYTDDDGTWGYENDDWCGCGVVTEPEQCEGAQGYPCCQFTRDVYEEDDDGLWGIENGDWCIIRN